MTWFSRFRRDATTRLAEDIVSAADGCARKIMSKLKPRSTEPSDETWYRLLCEFLYLFLHVTSRSALTLLGPARTTEFVRPLAPRVAKTYIEAILGHWPADVKRNIEMEFLENLSVAQAEYAACRALYIEGKPFSRDAVVDKGAFEIAEIVGDPDDVADLMSIRSVIVAALVELNIPRRIKEAARMGA